MFGILFFRSMRDGLEQRTRYEGLSLGACISLLSDIGHSSIEQITEEQYFEPVA